MEYLDKLLLLQKHVYKMAWEMGQIDLKKEASLAQYFKIRPRDVFSWDGAP